jgi:hypothetical protein
MVLKAAKSPPRPHALGLAAPHCPAARSVVQDQDPTDQDGGQGHRNSDVGQPAPAQGPVRSMPVVVVNGSDFVR